MKRLENKEWAESTRKTYACKLKCYMDFCERLRITTIVPVTPRIIATFIGYMTDIKGFKYSTIQNYLTIVRHLHRANKFDDPMKDSWIVSQVLRGAKRELGDAQKAATPIEPHHLQMIRKALNLERVKDMSFWMACLIGFFGFLRPGNFLVKDIFDPERDLCVGDVSCHAQWYVIPLKITKTLQFREKRLQVPLPRLRNATLSPAAAMDKLLVWHSSMATQTDRPLLVGSVEALTYSAFSRRLNMILSEAGCKEKFSGHSFRRGGATWALKCGLPGEIITQPFLTRNLKAG